jgi:2-polyprenyl-3-methyl-5-hydroxy-6-metoxy-1,4-benzoquinol methylase
MPSATPPGQGLLRREGLLRRDRRPEVMDQPGLDPHEHARALAGLRRINGISGLAGSLLAPIQALARRRGGAPLQVLELACGGGDTAIDLALMAQRRGLALELRACDLNPEAVRIAQANAQRRGAAVQVFTADALAAPPAPGEADVVFCSLFLHHLADADAERLLALMAQRARHLVLVNDLIRSRLGYALAWAGTRLLSRSWVVHTDGPLSVRAAFQPAEVLAMAERAGLAGATLQRCWPERYLLRWERGLGQGHVCAQDHA